MGSLGDEPHAKWLEPSHGTGVFVEAISALGVDKGRITAIDLDAGYRPADDLATAYRGVDFLDWAARTGASFDRIVGNPPFVSIRCLPRQLREVALSTVDLNGAPIGGNANLWYAFVLRSIRLLREGGTLGFVLPSAAEFANYSTHIRDNVAKVFGRVEVYRCMRPLFDNVQDGTLVAIAREYRGGPGLVRKQTVLTRRALIHQLSLDRKISGHKCPVRPKVFANKTVRFDRIAKIAIGAVTGDANFFLMSEEKRRELSLPKTALQRIVSKAKHLRTPIFTDSEWERLKTERERVWLFNPNTESIKHPAVQQYLSLTVEKGGCHREAYKVRIRDPWYKTPLPKKPDAFVSGMTQPLPWLSINAAQNVNATNTLYVLRFISRDAREWYKWALAMLSSCAWKQIRRLGRRYPDGLIKYEPGSLTKLELPVATRDLDFEDLYTKAVSHLLRGDVRIARELADAAVD